MRLHSFLKHVEMQNPRSTMNLSRDWKAGQNLKMWGALCTIAESSTSGSLNWLLTALKLWQCPWVQLTSRTCCHSSCHHLNLDSFVSFLCGAGVKSRALGLLRLFVCLIFLETSVSPMEPLSILESLCLSLQVLWYQVWQDAFVIRETGLCPTTEKFQCSF